MSTPFFQKKIIKEHAFFYLFGKRLFSRRLTTKEKLERDIAALRWLPAALDITKLPPARGLARDIQLASLKVLKEVDAICKKAGIEYFLACGTLLGAVRHGGFIPWDDDIDIQMTRENVNRFKEAFDTYCTRDEFFLDIVEGSRKSKHHYCRTLMKIRHKTLPGVNVDIFPLDGLADDMDIPQRIEFTNYVRKIQMEAVAQGLFRDTSRSTESIYKSLREKITQPSADAEHAKCFYVGIEFYYDVPRTIVYDRTMLFPVKTISFEGMQFPCPNEPEIYLTAIYGDYMAFPTFFRNHLDTSVEYSLEKMIEIKRYVMGN